MCAKAQGWCHGHFLVDFLFGYNTRHPAGKSWVIRHPYVGGRKRWSKKIRWLKRRRGFPPGRSYPIVMEMCVFVPPNSSPRSCERNFPYLSSHHCWVWDSWEFSPRFGGWWSATWKMFTPRIGDFFFPLMLTSWKQKRKRLVIRKGFTNHLLERFQ